MTQKKIQTTSQKKKVTQKIRQISYSSNSRKTTKIKITIAIN